MITMMMISESYPCTVFGRVTVGVAATAGVATAAGAPPGDTNAPNPGISIVNATSSFTSGGGAGTSLPSIRGG